MIVVVTAAVALVAAGVAIGILSQRDTPAAQPGRVNLQDIAASQAALPQCSAVFVPGKPIDYQLASNGCNDKFGNLQLPGAFNCIDGKHLWQVDAKTGAEPGYGREGEPYVAQVGAEVAADPGYKAAYNACHGIKPD